jgi:hypothetical protein
MRTLLAVLLPIAFLGLFVGCAHTTGDAALRAGHLEQAAALYKQGAEQGDASAALKLGLLIERGNIRKPEYGVAARWYERACELGSLPGCHDVGVSYEYGSNGVTKDISKAKDGYLKAAERGFMLSQYNLASLYSNQYIEPQNDVEGYKWMIIARIAAQKCQGQPLCDWILKDPPGHTTRLKSRLSAAQIIEAESLAKSWKPKM